MSIGIVTDKAITPIRKRAAKRSYAEEEAELMAGRKAFEGAVYVLNAICG